MMLHLMVLGFFWWTIYVYRHVFAMHLFLCAARRWRVPIHLSHLTSNSLICLGTVPQLFSRVFICFFLRVISHTARNIYIYRCLSIGTWRCLDGISALFKL